MTERTCRAIKQHQLTSFKDFLHVLLGPEPERCGARAVKDTSLGPLCQACYDRIEENRKNRTSLLGILQAEFPNGFFNPPPFGPPEQKDETHGSEQSATPGRPSDPARAEAPGKDR